MRDRHLDQQVESGIMHKFPAQKNMHKAPEDYLDKDPGSGRIMAHARLLQKLGNRFANTVPGALSYGVRVVNFKHGALVLHTDSGALAVKLRQMSKRICQEMAQTGIDCQTLEVKVVPRTQLDEQHHGQVKPLSRAAQSSLEKTSAGLPGGPLRNALETLLARAAKAE